MKIKRRQIKNMKDLRTICSRRSGTGSKDEIKTHHLSARGGVIKNKMSLWIYKKDKNGKTILWVIDIAFPFVIMLLIGLLAALTGPTLFQRPAIMLSMPFAFSAAGFLLLLISKISLYRKGIWFSFGTRQMTKGNATLYRTAYFLIALGVLIQLLLLNALLRA